MIYYTLYYTLHYTSYYISYYMSVAVLDHLPLGGALALLGERVEALRHGK